MSFIDIVILIFVISLFCYLGYNLFFKKEKSHCAGCSKIMQAKKTVKKMKKEFK